MQPARTHVHNAHNVCLDLKFISVIGYGVIGYGLLW
jgi:hypothetical protein